MRVASTKPHNNRAREVLTREYLEQEYVAKRRSAGSIGKELGVHQGVVINQLRLSGFEVRPISYYDTSPNLGIYSDCKYADILTKEFLQEQYVDKERSANDIGKQLNISYREVLDYLIRLGFEIRGRAFYSQGERNSTYGVERTQNWRRKIAEANKGQKVWLGRRHSPESRALISTHHADFRLEKHPGWQGGKSFEPYTTEFNRQLKDLIRLRDGYRCQLCGVPEAECFEKLHPITLTMTSRTACPAI